MVQQVKEARQSFSVSVQTALDTMCVHPCVCPSLRMPIRVCVLRVVSCVCVFVCVCVYVCMCVCVCVSARAR